MEVGNVEVRKFTKDDQKIHAGFAYTCFLNSAGKPEIFIYYEKKILVADTI
jgi:hypothetical protein